MLALQADMPLGIGSARIPTGRYRCARGYCPGRRTAGCASRRPAPASLLNGRRLGRIPAMRVVQAYGGMLLWDGGAMSEDRW